MDLIHNSTNNRLSDNLTIISNEIELPKKKQSYFIASNSLDYPGSALKCMRLGYVGYLCSSMSLAQQEQEISYVEELVQKLAILGGKYIDIDFKSDNESLIVLEHFLQNSLVREDEETFSGCLELISQHQFTQNYPAIIRQINGLLGNMSISFLTWYMVIEMVEVLRHHVFYPANKLLEIKRNLIA